MVMSSALAYTKLQKGDKNGEVLAMQKALKTLGYSIATDGSFGASTENVVKSFQRSNGLAADGVAGNATLTLLYSLAAAKENSSNQNNGGNNNSSGNSSGNSSAPSISGTPQTATVITPSGSLNMRLSADGSSKTIGSIPRGAVITVYQYSSAWYYTFYNGVGGYVNKDYLSFSSSPTPTPTPTQAPISGGSSSSGMTAVVTTPKGSLNVRSTASDGNNVIGTVPYSAKVTVLSKGTHWSKIYYNGLTGYVMTQYLTFDPIPDITATPSPSPAPVQPPSGVSAVVITSGGSLNMRSTPSTGTNIISTIPNGATITVTARGTTWSAVYFNGKSGYVQSKFLAFNAVTATPTASPTPTPTPTSAPQINQGTSGGGMNATIYTGNGSLNLRSTPSLGTNIIDTIPDGSQVLVLDKGTVWSAVVYGNQSGYVMTSYLRFTTAATPTPTPSAAPIVSSAPSSGITAYVNTGGGSLNLRAQANTDGTILDTIPNGTKILVVQQGPTWCAVYYNGIYGHVMSSFLMLMLPTATPTTAPVATVPPASGQLTACVTTAGGSLNLRDMPSTSGTVIDYIPNGTGITVTQRGESWCAVIYNGTSGYVMTSFLTFLTTNTNPPTPTPVPESSGTQTASYAIVTTSGGTLNLRAEKSTTSKILDDIDNGETLLVTLRGDTWCGVTYAGTSGYVMTKYLTFTATAPAPDEEEENSDPSQYKRTLKKGMVGTDVDWVQSRLKALDYDLALTGTYDDQTISAVKFFQSQNALSTDGLAGSLTFAMLRSENARKAGDAPLNYTTLRVDDQGPAVTSMQKALKELGYNVTVNGDFDAATHNAVVAFQQRNDLVISGIADSLTRQIIHSDNAKPYSTPVEVLPADAGVIAGPTLSEMQLLHWQNEIKPNVKSGQTFLIFDPNTNISWNLKFYSLGRHADSQPASWRDTQLMNRSFGTTSWTIHPVYVLLPTGQWTIATMHNMPHLYGSINDNGFGGHLCVHFLRDMAEAQRNDPNYGVNNQKSLRNAWKALTGETIDY